MTELTREDISRELYEIRKLDREIEQLHDDIRNRVKQREELYGSLYRPIPRDEFEQRLIENDKWYERNPTILLNNRNETYCSLTSEKKLMIWWYYHNDMSERWKPVKVHRALQPWIG